MADLEVLQDAAVLMEVIEHLDPDRIPALERVVFGAAAFQARGIPVWMDRSGAALRSGDADKPSGVPDGSSRLCAGALVAAGNCRID